MRHASWFKLILRFLGVYMLGLSVPAVCGAVLQAVPVFNDFVWRSDWGHNAFSAATHYTLYNFGPVLQLALGLYLLLDARWLIRVCIHNATTRCPACRYDLTGSAPARCPECGVSLPVDTFLSARTLLQSADQTPESLPAVTGPAPSAPARPPADLPQAPDR